MVQHSSFLQLLLQSEWKTKPANFSGNLFNVRFLLTVKGSETPPPTQTKPSKLTRDDLKYSALNQSRRTGIIPSLAPHSALFSPTQIKPAPWQSPVCISKQYPQLV